MDNLFSKSYCISLAKKCVAEGVRLISAEPFTTVNGDQIPTDTTTGEIYAGFFSGTGNLSIKGTNGDNTTLAQANTGLYEETHNSFCMFSIFSASTDFNPESCQFNGYKILFNIPT